MLESVVRQFLYHPIQIPSDAPVPDEAGSADEVWLEADDGERIHGLHWEAPAGRPTVLFLHGNAQSVFEWALVRLELTALEAGLLLIDYPGYGKSSGSPSEQGLYAAGRAALRWLSDEARVSRGDTVVFGKSLGGGVAVEIARGEQLGAVVLESTFRSIPAVTRHLLPMIPVGAVLQQERYDSASKIDELEAPLLVIHGTRDDLIPVSEGEALYEQAKGRKELYLVDGAGHNDLSLVAGRSYGERIRAFLDAQ